MAYYRASKVIKMRRNALGHSREEYSAEGPSDRTIFRMENGQVHIKESTYRRLSRAMDEEESTRQGILKTEDVGLLERMNDISKCFRVKDYEGAEARIQQLENKLDLSVERNKRYIECLKADLQYHKGVLGCEGRKETLEGNLVHGNRETKELLEHKWSFAEQECNYILGLFEVVRREKDYVRQKELLEQFLVILDAEYMEPVFNVVYQVAVKYRMGDVLGNMGCHREAIVADEKTLELCEEQQELRFLPEVYYDIFWNYMKLSEKETLTEPEEVYRKECLLRAYYLGKIYCPGKTLYERRIREFYPEELI